MHVIELSKKCDRAKLKKMVQWCNSFCNENYYYFEPYFYLDENAKFWFDDQNDVIAFRLRFNVNEGS